MKRIFVIDWCLIPFFLLMAITGISLHIAGHGNNQVIWHILAISHIISSLVFMIIVIMHTKAHWGWYKGFLKNGIGNKSRITVILSVIFLLTAITGTALLAVNGANSKLGLVHYKIGLFLIILCIVHTLKRIKILLKSLR